MLLRPPEGGPPGYVTRFGAFVPKRGVGVKGLMALPALGLVITTRSKRAKHTNKTLISVGVSFEKFHMLSKFFDVVQTGL